MEYSCDTEASRRDDAVLELFSGEFLFEHDFFVTSESPRNFDSCFDAFCEILRIAAFFKIYFSAKSCTTTGYHCSATNRCTSADTRVGSTRHFFLRIPAVGIDAYRKITSFWDKCFCVRENIGLSGEGAEAVVFAIYG